MKLTLPLLVRILLTRVIISLDNSNAPSQNLVTNGDFDTYSTAPSTYAQVCYANGWKSPNNSCSLVPGTGSPDYYNTNGTGGAKPPATWWATVSPHSGVGMEGFACYYSGSNYREYITRPLGTPLVPGTTYQVTFWATNGVSTLHYWGIKELGLYFSVGQPTQTLGAPILVTPQVELTAVFYSTTWQQFTFSFVATVACDWVTMGNFHNDANTTKSLFGPALPSSYGCYYYVDDISVMAAAPLPVKWLSFDGEYLFNEGVKLKWSTASEVNCDYYSVQRSTDGKSFADIGKLNGAGTSCLVHSYEYLDTYFNPGLVYYRLRQVDFNGDEYYSAIVPVIIKNSSMNIFPQPASTLVYFDMKDKIGKIVLTDLEGRVVMVHENFNSEEGLNIECLNSGIYICQLYTDKSFFSQGKLVIE